MAYTRLILTGAFLVLLSVLAVAESSEMAMVGTWHGSEGPITPGDDWWGLFPVEDGYVLEPTELTIEPDYAPMSDKTGTMTGKKLSVPQKTEALFLVRGVNGLKEGPVISLPQPPGGTLLYPGQSLALPQSDRDLSESRSLTALGTFTAYDSGGSSFSNYRLQINSVNAPTRGSQDLISVGTCDSYTVPKVHWGGDLDRDGKMDLLLDISKAEHYSHYVLYLSSAAKDGELVGKVGEWKTVGC